ncbi:TPA: hypothetical protein ACH3X1_016237 [Trebouxia sp. C0004]
MYYVSCSRKVSQNTAGTAILQQINMAVPPNPACAAKHATIQEMVGCEVRYGMVRHADAEQYQKQQNSSSGLFNAPESFKTAVMRPHASGFCKGPALHPVKAYHISAAAKRQVLGRGQPQAALLLDFQRHLYADKKAWSTKERLRPAGIVMGAAQMLTQGFNNFTNLQDRNSAPAKRHGLPNRPQTSSYGARKVLSTIPNRKSIIKIVKQDCVEKRPNRTSSYLVPKFKCLLPPKNPQW